MRPAKQCLPPMISVKIPDRKIGRKTAGKRYPYASAFLVKNSFDTYTSPRNEILGMMYHLQFHRLVYCGRIMEAG